MNKACYACRVKILGALKSGKKTLFLRAEDHSYHSKQPVCLLDFYVQEPYQRSGIGKALFEVDSIPGCRDEDDKLIR